MNNQPRSWAQMPSVDTIEKTIHQLGEHGITAILAKDKEDAKTQALALIPEGSEVMTTTSVTADELGISEHINKSGKFIAVKEKLSAMDRNTQHTEMQKLGAAPVYAIGSVHAVTEDGKVVIASNSGSQLPAYAYGASHVIWLVGVQKIVKDIGQALERIEEYTLPLESERARKAYGVAGSFISKLLIINKEVKPNRLHIIFIPEVIGY